MPRGPARTPPPTPTTTRKAPGRLRDSHCAQTSECSRWLRRRPPPQSWRWSRRARSGPVTVVTTCRLCKRYARGSSPLSGFERPENRCSDGSLLAEGRERKRLRRQANHSRLLASTLGCGCSYVKGCSLFAGSADAEHWCWGAGRYGGVGSRGWSRVGGGSGVEQLPEVAGEVSFEAADRFAFGVAFGDFAIGVVARRRVVAGS